MSEETVSEIRMRISAFLEKGDFAAALTEMDKIKTAAKGIEEEQINAAHAASESAAAATTAQQAIDDQSRSVSSSARGAVVGLQGVRSLIQGDLLTAVNQFSHASRNLFDQWGKLSVAAQGFGVGWQVGTMIDQVLGLSDAIADALVPPIENTKDGFEKAAAAASALADTRFNGLISELDTIVKNLDKITTARKTAARRSDTERRAEYEADVAAIGTKPEGPARDRELLARKERYQTEQRTADTATQADLQRDLITTRAELETLRKKGKFEVNVAEATAKGTEENLAKGGPLAPTAEAVRLARAEAERLKQKYAAQEQLIQERLDKTTSELEDLQSEMRVRAAKTRKEQSEGTAAKGEIDTKESAIAERDRAQRDTEARERDTETRKRDIARQAEIKRELAQRTAAGSTPETQALAQFEAEKTPVYKRSIKGRNEQAALETYAAQSQAAQTAAIAALKAELAALQARLTPAAPAAPGAVAAGVAPAAPAAVAPVVAPAAPVAPDLKPLKTAAERLATSQSGALDAIIAAMQRQSAALAAAQKTADTY